MMQNVHNPTRTLYRGTMVLVTASAITLSLASPTAAQIQNTAAPAVTFAPQATAAAQEPLTVQDWVKRPEMLGDWGGLRTKAGQHGFTLAASWTQFFQNSPTMNDIREWDYGGKLDLEVTQNFSTMGWQGVAATGHLEFRYGDVPLLAGGTLMPTNAALLFPEREGSEAKITSLYVSKTFGTSAVLAGGRFNTVDMYQKPFTGGRGLDNFTNLAFVAPPLVARTTPPSVEGMFFTTLKNAEPFVTVGLYESTEDGFFKNGATFMASVSVPLKLFATPGHYVFSTTASSIVANSLDQDGFTLLPPSNLPLVQEENAWTFDFTFDQYLWWDPATKTGFGLFGMIGASDSNPSKLDIFGHIGIGGNSPISNRSQDNFGVGFFYGGVSNTLRETLDPLLRLRDEYGFEGFYNFAVTGWSQVSAHFQFIDPFLVGSETRGFFSVRWKLTF